MVFIPFKLFIMGEHTKNMCIAFKKGTYTISGDILSKNAAILVSRKDFAWIVLIIMNQLIPFFCFLICCKEIDPA